FLLSLGLDALTVHGRISKDMSKVPADWEEIGKVVTLRDQINPETVIIGNGDVLGLDDARTKVQKYHVDGVMFGRGIFRNPWLFNDAVTPSMIDKSQKLDLLRKHVLLFENTWRESKNFDLMKKFFKMYLSGFNGASD